MSRSNPLEHPNFIHAHKVEDVGDGLKLLTFPDGFRCYSHSSTQETELIYNEIFIRQEYLGDKLSLDDCRYVFDVGANIGLFTIFVKLRNPALVVHAFEPIKATYDVLVKNIELHGLTDVHLNNYALGNQDGGEHTMIFYPDAAGNATAHPQTKEKMKRRLTEILGQEQINYLAQSIQVHKVQLRTLSAVIDEQGVPAVDLLKIDCEGDEVAVLHGISKEHYLTVRQIAAEVHSDLQRAQVQLLLVSRGFSVFLDVGIAAENKLVYAVRR